MDFRIKTGDANQAFQLGLAVPEFSDQYYKLEEYHRRLGPGSLVLIAYFENQPVGFKAGYPRGGDHSFYSWMGGVIPEFRRKGVAQLLATEQEDWAKQQGYSQVWFKTRNQHKAMIMFGLNNGFYITDVQLRNQVSDHRIIMHKRL